MIDFKKKKKRTQFYSKLMKNNCLIHSYNLCMTMIHSK